MKPISYFLLFILTPLVLAGMLFQMVLMVDVLEWEATDDCQGCLILHHLNPQTLKENRQ